MVLSQTPRGGTHIKCSVEAPLAYRGIPLPKLGLRSLIRSRFERERARDREFLLAADAPPAAGT